MTVCNIFTEGPLFPSGANVYRIEASWVIILGHLDAIQTGKPLNGSERHLLLDCGLFFGQAQLLGELQQFCCGVGGLRDEVEACYRHTAAKGRQRGQALHHRMASKERRGLYPRRFFHTRLDVGGNHTQFSTEDRGSQHYHLARACL